MHSLPSSLSGFAPAYEQPADGSGPTPAHAAMATSRSSFEGRMAIELSRAEIALLIDALLQAEVTLNLLDERHAKLGFIPQLRAQQLSLADRLEDLMAGSRRA